MENIQHDIIEELSRKIQNRKQQILEEELKKRKIAIDPEEEKHKRFKSITCEIRNGEENYYYNDGTTSGMRIVTFKKPVQKFKDNTATVELRYH